MMGSRQQVASSRQVPCLAAKLLLLVLSKIKIFRFSGLRFKICLTEREEFNIDPAIHNLNSYFLIRNSIARGQY